MLSSASKQAASTRRQEKRQFKLVVRTLSLLALTNSLEDVCERRMLAKLTSIMDATSLTAQLNSLSFSLLLIVLKKERTIMCNKSHLVYLTIYSCF